MADIAPLRALADPLVVAGMNATILSIGVAAATVYVSSLLGTYSQLQEEVFGEVDRLDVVRQRVLGMSYGWGPPSEFAQNYQGRDGEPRKRLIDRLRNIVYTPTPALWGPEMMAGVPAPKAPARLGSEMMALLDTLTRHYPVIVEPRPTTIKEIREWLWAVSDCETVVRLDPQDRSMAYLYRSYEEERLRKSFSEQADLATAFGHTDVAEMIEKGLDELVHERMQHFSLTALDHYRSVVRDTRDIAQAIETRLLRLTTYESRLPKRRMLLAVGTAILVVFCTGVVAPMVAPRTPQVLATWVPGAFYVCTLLILLLLVSRRYPGV